MASRFNIAPSTVIPIVRGTPHRLDFVRWGFIPKWAKSEGPVPAGHINARAETAHEKPSFKAAFKSQRCLIPASGYYEWKKIHEKKQPFYIRIKDVPLMAFAGIWSSWKDINHETIETVAILTVPASDALSSIHERMPLVCSEQDYDVWLDSETKSDDVMALMQPKVVDFQYYAVSPRVNHPRFDDVACIHPLS